MFRPVVTIAVVILLSIAASSAVGQVTLAYADPAQPAGYQVADIMDAKGNATPVANPLRLSGQMVVFSMCNNTSLKLSFEVRCYPCGCLLTEFGLLPDQCLGPGIFVLECEPPNFPVLYLVTGGVPPLFPLFG